MMTVAASELRKRAADVVNRVAYHGDRIRIVRHGKAVAAIVPMEDFERLRAYEDHIDLVAARHALQEAKQPTEKRSRKVKGRMKVRGSRVPVARGRAPRGLIPWTKVKTDLGL